MTPSTIRLTFRTAFVAALSLCLRVGVAQQPAAAETGAPPPIPGNKIAALQSGLQQWDPRASSADKRRSCKRLAREGLSLVEEHPGAPNRFAVLGIVLQSQKRLLDLDNSERNRQALFETCAQLADATDEYAESRLEADMLLSERDLAAKEAGAEERTKALEEMIARYRGTSAEAKSLMMASLIAPQLEADELQEMIIEAMDERFAGDTAVIAFRRSFLALKALAVKCEGKYTRADGTTLFLPADRIGHHCIMVYWSAATAGVEDYLNEVKACQEQYPGVFDVFSLNLDELSDAGERRLRELGLGWAAVHLPGGRRNEAYRAYAARDPIALVVNAYGYTILAPKGAPSDSSVGMRRQLRGGFKIDDARISHDRYLAQLQSLFIGDFLVTDGEDPFSPSLCRELKAVDVDADKLRAIQNCFVAAPLRYRMTRDEASANYAKAEKLCRKAINERPEAPDLWPVRNRRIIALLGLWNLSGEPRYLEQAVEEARRTLGMELPPGADVVPRFCLAKDAFRCEDPDPDSVLPAFIEATGGTDAPASALAAAAILALDANSRELHEQYRSRLLDEPIDGGPQLWSVRAFLQNRYHRYHLLRPNYTRVDQAGSPRSYIVNHGEPAATRRFPDAEFRRLDGSPLILPRDTDGKLTLLLFVEPPDDPEADFPVVLDRKGNPTRDDHIRHVMDNAMHLAEIHINGDVSFVAAFLCDDAQRVGSLVKENAWTCEPAVVPGGLRNPMVRRLGILSADRVPNVFLLRRDGTIAWHSCGLAYKAEFGYPFAVLLAMKVHIEVCEVETGFQALTQGDFREAARVFAGPFPPEHPDRYGWRPPRFHGKALAHTGLEQWDAALDAVDKAVAAHKLSHNPHKRGKKADTWQEDVAAVIVETPCDVFSELWSVKAVILEHLGRQDEAAEVRRRSREPVQEDYSDVYRQFHNRLRDWRLNNGPEALRR